MMWKTSALVVATVGSAAAQTGYQIDIYGFGLFADNRDQANHWDSKCVATSSSMSSDAGKCNLGYSGANCNSCAPKYYQTGPDANGIFTCTLKTCDPEVHCNSLWNADASAGPGPTHFCATASATDMSCTCTGNVEGPNCNKCKITFTNWPYCDVTVTEPIVLADVAKTSGCSGHGVFNPHYAGSSGSHQYDLSNKANVILKLGVLGYSECGRNWCTNSEYCYAWTAQAAQMDITDGSDLSSSRLAGNKCLRKGFVGCGNNNVCDPGEICLDAFAGSCTNNYPLLHPGRTPCLPSKALMNNGTLIVGVATSTTEFCEAWETCCDGICCNDGGRAAGNSRAREGVCTDRAAQQEFVSALGYDLRWSADGGLMQTLGQDAYMARKYCDPYTFQTLHGFRIVLIPILLTFVYILAIALGLKAGSPGPIKIISLVMLVICIFSAYHYEWQRGAFLALVVVYTLFGTGSGSKPGWTPFLVFFLQLIVFTMLFRVQIVGFFVNQSSHFENYQFLGDRNILERCAETYNYFKNHHYSLPYNEEITWSYLPNNDVKWGYPMRQTTNHRIETYPGGEIQYVPIELYHGYCAIGWIAAMDFFYAVQGFLLLALIMFSAQALFNGGADGAAGSGGKAGASAVMPQEVEIP